jgi:hypothetical protein
MATSRSLPFEAPFRREIPNLGAPDADGWAIGDCPYCQTPGGLKANLRTGRWLCLPQAPGPLVRKAPPPLKGLRGGRDRRAGHDGTQET